MEWATIVKDGFSRMSAGRRSATMSASWAATLYRTIWRMSRVPGVLVRRRVDRVGEFADAGADLVQPVPRHLGQLTRAQLCRQGLPVAPDLLEDVVVTHFEELDPVADRIVGREHLRILDGGGLQRGDGPRLLIRGPAGGVLTDSVHENDDVFLRHGDDLPVPMARATIVRVKTAPAIECPRGPRRGTNFPGDASGSQFAV
jgi:hypothetical protein